MTERQPVRLDDRRHRWRFVCPREHRSWEPTNHHFWCKKCASHSEVDGVFYELVDRKTGKELSRTEVQLLTDFGPYDRDLDQEGTA